MNLSEQIKIATKALGDKRESLVALTAKLEETPKDATIVTQVDTLAGEIELETKGLEALQRAEKALASRALPIVPGGGDRGPLILPAAREKGSLEILVRAAVVAAEAYHTRRAPADVLKERYADAGDATRIVAGLVAKAAPQGPAMTNVAGYAAELVQQTYAAFMSALTGPAAVPSIPFTSVGTFESGGPIIVPYRQQRGAYPGNFDGAFRKEGDPIRVGRLTLGAQTMHPYSMGVIGTFTKELFKRSTPNIEAVIRQAILEDTAEALDGYVLGASPAVADLRPKGLTNAIAVGDTAPSTGSDYAAIEYDLQARIVQMFTVRRLGKNPVWVMNTANRMALMDKVNPLGVYVFRDELNKGQLKGLPIVASLNVALDVVMLVDGGSIAFAGGVPLFEGSDVATLHEEGDTAEPLVAGALTATPQRSLFQTHSAAIKTTWDVSWLELHAGAVQTITACAWNAPPAAAGAFATPSPNGGRSSSRAAA